MLTAGTLVPFFQVIQPTLQNISASDVKKAIGNQNTSTSDALARKEAQVDTCAPASSKKESKLEREMRQASSLPSWYPKAEQVARKFGFKLQSEDGSMGSALLLIALFVIPILAASRFALMIISQYCLCWAATKVVSDLRVDILRKIQDQALPFHRRIDVGQLMTRATSDPQIVQAVIQNMFSELARAPFEILVSVGFIVYFAIVNHMLPTLLLITIGMPAFMIPTMMLGKAIRKWTLQSLQRNSAVGSRIHEILTCIRAVKAYNTESFENEKYELVMKGLVSTSMRSVRWGLMVTPMIETVGILLLSGFLVWCFSAHVALSNILPMLAPLMLIYKPLKKLASIQVSIEVTRASLHRIWSILDVDVHLPERDKPLRKESFTDKIVFDDVSYRYDTSKSDAVSHASFEIPRGSMVAVVGGTGSGKTTLSYLLARLFDPSAGKVSIDGIDLKDLKISDLRKLIGSVQQETVLFNDTIEENIRYGSPSATRDQVIEAAKMANAHEFIISHPEGYSKLCGEKGFALSGGERQRIAIARAILRNPPILILDEATSALDTVTERLVQDALINLMKNRTVFAIAHRLSTVRGADTILVMDHGIIVERGTHDELYAANSAYRKLCDMQDMN
jgi:subfamily B ATP-binding cassette protein MsbA